MRVVVHGDSAAATSLRSLITRDKTLVLGERVGAFAIKFDSSESLPWLAVDGVDSELERVIVSDMAKVLGAVLVVTRPSGTDDLTITFPVNTPEAQVAAVETLVYQALLGYARPVSLWLRLWRRLRIGVRRG